MIIKNYLSLIKFSHTVFALPFALIGYTLGVIDSGFSVLTLIGVIVCMVLARSAAMGFNRLIDRRFDAANPRTASREIPSGVVSVRAATWLVVVCSAGFVAVSATFNTLTLMLSPVALIVVLGYSYTKRFTSLCHLVLGLGLAIASMAAYIAVTGHFSWVPAAFSLIVLTWVAGFDIIFALQDVEFDKGEGLNSIPARIGVRNALIASSILHCLTFSMAVYIATVLITIFGATAWVMWLGVASFGSLLFYQHWIVLPTDLSRVNQAFGTTNGIASVIYATAVIVSVVFG